MKQAIWDKFCSRFSIAETCVPLFATDAEGNVQHKPVGKDQRPILKRSDECEAMILSVTDLFHSLIYYSISDETLGEEIL